jgi:hypothetical protein
MRSLRLDLLRELRRCSASGSRAPLCGPLSTTTQLRLRRSVRSRACADAAHRAPLSAGGSHTSRRRNRSHRRAGRGTRVVRSRSDGCRRLASLESPALPLRLSVMPQDPCESAAGAAWRRVGVVAEYDLPADASPASSADRGPTLRTGRRSPDTAHITTILLACASVR